MNKEMYDNPEDGILDNQEGEAQGNDSMDEPAKEKGDSEENEEDDAT